MVLGYEDCNDAHALRLDLVLQLACDVEPQATSALSSQPTLCRLENAVDGRSVCKVLGALERQYLDSFTSSPETVVLDIDSTDARPTAPSSSPSSTASMTLTWTIRCWCSMALAGQQAPALATAQMDALWLKLLKVAAQVTRSARRLWVRLPATFPLASVFLALAGWLGQAPS